MAYIALQDITLNDYDVKPGEVIPEEKMRGYYPSTLTRLGFAKFVPEAQPVEFAPKAEEPKAVETPIYVEETVAPTETRASVVKSGVWFQVFVSDKKVFHSRNESEAEAFAKDFNAKNKENT